MWRHFAVKFMYQKTTENFTKLENLKCNMIFGCEIYWPQNCIKCDDFLQQNIQKSTNFSLLNLLTEKQKKYDSFRLGIFWPEN